MISLATIDSIKGYLLEEVLAYLVRNAGYNLLVDPSQDPIELERRGNGLVVRGRGGVHQADVLGQFSWFPAFTFPVRLFVEAKFRSHKTALPAARNAVGVVDDINQNYFSTTHGTPLLQRYAYRYALFSTSGFTSDAIHYAMAHQISLVDLSGGDFTDLRRLIERLAEIIMPQWQTDRPSAKQTRLRATVRRILGTWPEGVSMQEIILDGELEFRYLGNNFEHTLRAGAQQLGEFFVGTANSPFLLVLKPDDVNAFLTYARQHPSHGITLHWSWTEAEGTQWTVRSAQDRNAYKLTFGLPKSLADWIFAPGADFHQRAWEAKQRFLSSIMIYRYTNGLDELFRLVFDPAAARHRE